MTYTSFNKLWESKFDNHVSERNKVPDFNLKKLKLEVIDTYKKHEKITKNLEPTDELDVISKGFLDEK